MDTLENRDEGLVPLIKQMWAAIDYACKNETTLYLNLAAVDIKRQMDELGIHVKELTDEQV